MNSPAARNQYETLDTNRPADQITDPVVRKKMDIKLRQKQEQQRLKIKPGAPGL